MEGGTLGNDHLSASHNNLDFLIRQAVQSVDQGVDLPVQNRDSLAVQLAVGIRNRYHHATCPRVHGVEHRGSGHTNSGKTIAHDGAIVANFLMDFKAEQKWTLILSF